MFLLDQWQHASLTAKRLTVFFGAIAAIAGAITATNAAWPIVEPLFPAHRGFVIEQVGGVQATTNELLIWKFEDSKARTKAEADNWTIQSQKENDPQTKALIQQRIEQLNREQNTYEQRINKLKGH